MKPAAPVTRRAIPASELARTVSEAHHESERKGRRQEMLERCPLGPACATCAPYYAPTAMLHWKWFPIEARRIQRAGTNLRSHLARWRTPGAFHSERQRTSRPSHSARRRCVISPPRRPESAGSSFSRPSTTYCHSCVPHVAVRGRLTRYAHDASRVGGVQPKD